MADKCDVCLNGDKKYRLDIPDGYVEVCSFDCAREENSKWWRERVFDINGDDLE